MATAIGSSAEKARLLVPHNHSSKGNAPQRKGRTGVTNVKLYSWHLARLHPLDSCPCQRCVSSIFVCVALLPCLSFCAPFVLEHVFQVSVSRHVLIMALLVFPSNMFCLVVCGIISDSFALYSICPFSCSASFQTIH